MISFFFFRRVLMEKQVKWFWKRTNKERKLLFICFQIDFHDFFAVFKNLFYLTGNLRNIDFDFFALNGKFSMEILLKLWIGGVFIKKNWNFSGFWWIFGTECSKLTTKTKMERTIVSFTPKLYFLIPNKQFVPSILIWHFKKYFFYKNPNIISQVRIIFLESNCLDCWKVLSCQIP